MRCFFDNPSFMNLRRLAAFFCGVLAFTADVSAPIAVSEADWDECNSGAGCGGGGIVSASYAADFDNPSILTRASDKLIQIVLVFFITGL